MIQAATIFGELTSFKQFLQETTNVAFGIDIGGYNRAARQLFSYEDLPEISELIIPSESAASSSENCFLKMNEFESGFRAKGVVTSPSVEDAMADVQFAMSRMKYVPVNNRFRRCSIKRFTGGRFTADIHDSLLQPHPDFVDYATRFISKPGHITLEDIQRFWNVYGCNYIHSCKYGAQQISYGELLIAERPVDYGFKIREIGGNGASDKSEFFKDVATNPKTWRVIDIEEMRPVWSVLPDEGPNSLQQQFKSRVCHVWPMDLGDGYLGHHKWVEASRIFVRRGRGVVRNDDGSRSYVAYTGTADGKPMVFAAQQQVVETTILGVASNSDVDSSSTLAFENGEVVTITVRLGKVFDYLSLTKQD